MLLRNVSLNNDEIKRLIYVGLTRAKKELYIHYNKNFFDNINIPNIEIAEDSNSYPESNEILLQLSYSDVDLGFFRDKKIHILKIRSGSELFVDGYYLSARIENRLMRVVKFSKACVKELESFKAKGYIPYRATVRFMVAWKGENDLNESAVILPDLYLKKE